MDVSFSVTPFRIPERIKMHSEWIEHATLDRIIPSIYRAGNIGEAPVWFPQKPLFFRGRKLTNQLPNSCSQ